MTDLNLTTKKHSLAMKQEVTVYVPSKAVALHVMPFLNEDWINNSKEVNNTKLSTREWLGLALTSQTMTNYLGAKTWIGEDFEGGDGVILFQAQSPHNDKDGIFVEQTLATRKSGALDTIKEIERVVRNKTTKGPQYVDNKHLVVWSDVISVTAKAEVFHKIAEDSGYSSVTFIATDGEKIYTYLFIKGDPGMRYTTYNWADISNW